MAIINDIDCGVYAPWNAPAQTWNGPQGGQAVKTIFIEGSGEEHIARGGIAKTRTETIWMIPPAIGGAPAGSMNAALYLFRQLFELSNNKDLQPCFIRWRSGGGVEVPDSEDGWYIITDIKPNMEFMWNGNVPVTITVIYLGPAYPPDIFGMGWMGGSMGSSYAIGAIHALFFPPTSTTEATFNRNSTEGLIPGKLNPLSTFSPFIPPAVIANIFNGGLHVFDTLNTGTNPVPTTGGITMHANWVEVFNPQHNFIGDCVITNGLLLLLLVAGASPGLSLYLWQTALSPANWQLCTTIYYSDNAATVSTLWMYKVKKISFEKSVVNCILFTAGQKFATIEFSLIRGERFLRLSFRPQSQDNTSNESIVLSSPNALKGVFTESVVNDASFAPVNPGPTANYGYGAGFPANASFPYIIGFFYQSFPAIQTKPFARGSAVNLGLGDSGGPLQNATRNYGIFAMPFGSAGVYSTANLQQEIENGTITQAGAGPVIAVSADGALASPGSGNNTVKALAGAYTVSQFIINSATLWTPPAGTYKVAIRARTGTNGAGALNELTFDSGGTAGLGGTSLKPNQLTTAFAWFYSPSFTLDGVKTVQPRAYDPSTGTTLTVDWIIDEIMIIPQGLGGSEGPADLWQQWLFERDAEMVRS